MEVVWKVPLYFGVLEILTKISFRQRHLSDVTEKVAGVSMYIALIL
jgi:hypothetical protein